MSRNFKTPNMMKWAKDLFPLCRSITGKGTQATLRYFQKLNPSFKIIKFKSGKKVFDWKIPLEWNISDAYIKHESGKKFADFKKIAHMLHCFRMIFCCFVGVDIN